MRIDLVGTTADFWRFGLRHPLPLNHLPGENRETAGRIGEVGLATPKRVQKLQMALHAKAKAEAGYRFYALYDKIYREDLLAHA